MLKRILVSAALVATFASTAQAEMSPEVLAKKVASGNIVADKTVIAECGACHMVYGPVNLLGESWRMLMNDLPNHFGEDASLSEPTRTYIEDFLVGKSMDASGSMYGKMMAKKIKKKKKTLPIRLSEMPGWAKDHSANKIGADIWAKVNNNKSDCRGCHEPGLGG